MEVIKASQMMMPLVACWAERLRKAGRRLASAAEADLIRLPTSAVAVRSGAMMLP